MLALQNTITIPQPSDYALEMNSLPICKDQYEEGYKTYTYAEFVAAGLESPLGNIDTASSGETSNDNCD
jgi:hypothetical protein